jgi:hypothetical protein
MRAKGNLRLCGNRLSDWHNARKSECISRVRIEASWFKTQSEFPSSDCARAFGRALSFKAIRVQVAFRSQSQIVIHSNGDLQLGTEIAFGRLDRGVAEQEFDLLQIPAVLPAQLGAGPAEIVGAEVLDADFLR